MYSKSYKCYRNSFTYTNLTEQSNPNRSVFISKSLINSRKQESDQDSSEADEDVEALEEEEEEGMSPNLVLDPIKTNSEYTNCLINANNAQSDHTSIKRPISGSGQVSTFDSRLSSIDREPEKFATAQNSIRNIHNMLDGKREYDAKSETSTRENKKPIMKLDLSSILNGKLPSQHAPIPENISYHPQTVTNTANNSQVNSLNNSQTKASLNLAEQSKENNKRILPKLNLPIIENISLCNTAVQSFKTSENTHTSAQVQSENIALNTSNRVSLEHYVNVLVEENEMLRKVAIQKRKILNYNFVLNRTLNTLIMKIFN